MKKALLTCLLFIAVFNLSFSQTNTFPASGNVGIGTTTPANKLEIYNNSNNATNLVLSADYINSYRWRFNTVDRGNAIDMDITASNYSDVQQTILTLSPTYSGRPSFALEGNWLVANSGNIGIGTTSPAAKLDVNGNINSSSYQSAALGFYVNTTLAGFNNAAGTGYLSFRSNNVDNRMVIDPNGNIGIGTATPSSLLHVIGDAGTSFVLPTSYDYGGTQDGFNERLIHFVVTSATNGGVGSPTLVSDFVFSSGTWRAIFQGSFDNNYEGTSLGQTPPYIELTNTNNTIAIGSVFLTFTKNANNQLQVQASTNPALAPRGVDFKGKITIIPNIAGNVSGVSSASFASNVLIGKTYQFNSAYLLDVAGSVRSNAVVVNSTGADFVFAPKYKLAPLSFLEKYINQNHHLPEIPSAKQMQANGLNVGENQTKLLQKVEELTLYLIEKDKQLSDQKSRLNYQQLQISDQQKTNQTQQHEIDELKKQVSELLKRSK